ncbi:unnamed protein product [Acanthoscelides obtectus]|uniref:Uncharacterized protein n=1 Tax=Acanthoscelides obtectus TaxID=200917 RepID=A0A9P0JQT8_ACAOB|nr:unnamed protein product [Acanthoscelides obtectus]CAK1667970.1 Protein FAM200A [Acanthoscelides obtectus]
MRPNRLERHLKQQHPTLVLKTEEFFLLKQNHSSESGQIEITPDFGLGYKDYKLLQEQLFEQSVALLCENLDSDHKVLLFHIEVRWLSKGNMFARLYELKKEVILFLEFKEKQDFLTMYKDDIFQWRLGYLTDIFDSLNELNLKLQGRNNTIISNYDYIQAFISKLQLSSVF